MRRQVTVTCSLYNRYADSRFAENLSKRRIRSQSTQRDENGFEILVDLSRVDFVVEVVDDFVVKTVEQVGIFELVLLADCARKRR